jgi:hypothetical protein
VSVLHDSPSHNFIMINRFRKKLLLLDKLQKMVYLLRHLVSQSVVD